MGREKNKLGKLGEDIAARFLTQKGWQILERNYRSRFGEIDIVAKDKDFIVFVEVKSAKLYSSSFPKESITRRKQMQISKMALAFLKHFSLFGRNARFDVMAVYLGRENFSTPKIELVKNAFPLPVGF